MQTLCTVGKVNNTKWIVLGVVLGVVVLAAIAAIAYYVLFVKYAVLFVRYFPDSLAINHLQIAKNEITAQDQW